MNHSSLMEPFLCHDQELQVAVLKIISLSSSLMEGFWNHPYTEKSSLVSWSASLIMPSKWRIMLCYDPLIVFL
jgi:hypothetical protein